MHVRTKLLITSTLLASSALSAASGNNNPASVNYVNNAINNATAQLTIFAGNGLLKSGNTLSVNPFYKVGDLAQGGIVFFVDATGQHGLVAALNDAKNLNSAGSPDGSEDILWWPPSTTSGDYLVPPVQTGAISYGLGNGAPMTNLIIAAAMRAGAAAAANFTLDDGNYNYAAALAYEVADNTDDTQNCSGRFNCVGGWYLPNQTELKLAMKNLCNVSATNFTSFAANTDYWTSKQQTSTPTAADSRALVVAVKTDGNGCGGAVSFVNIKLATPPTAHVRQVRQF